MRLTIDEYSTKFKMSKEMIHSKIRAKKLNSVVENNITYIIVAQQQTPTQTLKNPPEQTKTTVAMVLSLYQRENKQLKDKIVQLETKIDKLIDDKERMLREEMNKIEQVYKTKDLQLKNFLEIVSAKLITEKNQTIHEVETVETRDTKSTQKVHSDEEVSTKLSLKEYLKTLDIEAFKKKIIKRRFFSAYGSDARVLKQNGRLYLDFSKYDYSDLLKH